MPKDLQWEMKRYDDPTRHLVNTDIDDLLDIEDAKVAKEAAESKKKKEQEAGSTPAAAAGAATPASADPAAGEGKEEGGEKAAPTAMDVDEPTPPDVKGDGLSAPAGGTRGRYHALCLHFTLPLAAYATMCLREITHQDTSTIYHTSLNCLEPGQHPAAAKGSAVVADASAGSGGDEAKATVASASKGAVIKVGSSLK